MYFIFMAPGVKRVQGHLQNAVIFVTVIIIVIVTVADFCN